MNGNHGKNEPLRLTDEELCAAAAFMEIPCLYGVSDRYWKRGSGSLRKRLLDVCASLELAGFLCVEPGGTVRLRASLYQALACMGSPEAVARLFAAGAAGTRRACLYRREEAVYVRSLDERGCLLKRAADEEELAGFLGGAFSGEIRACGALVLAKAGAFYEKKADLVWKAGENAPEERTALLHGVWEALTAGGGKEERR